VRLAWQIHCQPFLNGLISVRGNSACVDSRSTAPLVLQYRFCSRFAHFKLCAHFL
jgi:hypothetical protein